jgi:hypothetical protein
VLNFVPVPRKDIARGIDSFSPKGSIPDGYAESLVNMDTNASGKLSKRKGYEGYYGWVPFRVSNIRHSGTTIRLQFAESQLLDLSTTKSGPIVVYGRLSSAQTGDFTVTDVGHWYSGFNIVSKLNLPSGTATTTQTQEEHGFSTADIWVGLVESLSNITSDNQMIILDDLQIDTTTYDVDFVTTLATAVEAYAYYRDATAVAGTTYVTNLVATGIPVVDNDGPDNFTAAAHGLVLNDRVLITGLSIGADFDPNTIYYVTNPTTNTFQLAATANGFAIPFSGPQGVSLEVVPRTYKIPAVTHGLSNFNLVWKVYDTGTVAGKYVDTIPESVSINTSGLVTIELDINIATHRAYLTAAPLANVKITSASLGPNTLTITNPGSPFLFPSVYRFDGFTTSYQSVVVDSWAYDEATDTATVEYTMATFGESVEIYWVVGQIVANAIEIQDTTATSTSYTDTAPQLTVWGIDHTGAYRNASKPGGHVTHLDSYKRAGESRLVSGLGGNLFKALEYSEGATEYLFASLFANFRERVENDTGLAPLFWTTDPGSVRTRGSVYASDVLDNKARVTAATFVSSGVVDYTLSFTAKTGTVTFGSTVNGNDRLSVSGMANVEHVGDWPITAVTDAGNTVTVRVANPQVLNLTTNEAGTMGRAGVFTDQFTTEDASNFIAGDRLLTAAIADDLTCNVVAIAGNIHTLDGVTEVLAFPDGLQVHVRRTSDLVPLRDSLSADLVEPMVRGDMLRVTGLSDDRKIRVLGVQTQADQTVTLTGTGSIATLTAPLEHRLNSGDKILLTGSGLRGEFTILSTPTPTTATFASTATSGSTTLNGYMVQLDETLDVEDGPGVTTFTTDGRWVPVEAPTTAFDLAAQTYVRYFDVNDYDDQPALRSTIINDSMFLTNGDDEVFKFDGTDLYRAGLTRWQLQAFAQVDTSAAAQLSPGIEIAYTAKSDTGKFFRADAPALKPGDRVYESTADAIFLVTEVIFDSVAGDYKIVVRPEDDISSTPASGTLVKVIVYKYYARLNMVDKNNTLIASAASGSEDLVVDYTATGQIRLRMIPPPAFGAYDYDRIELELYRTVGNGSIFNLHTRRFVDFDLRDAYVDFYDALEDSLIEGRPDEVMTGLLGAELGTAWDQAPRAKHVTSLSNRLLLGNLKWYPELDLVFKPAANEPFIEAADLSGKQLVFRRTQSAGSVTDLVDVVATEFVTSTTAASITACTTTNFEVTSAAHGLGIGWWVYLHHNVPGTTNQLKFAGWWQTATVSTNTFTVDFNSDGVLGTDNIDRMAKASSPEDYVPVYIGTDGNYNQRDGNSSGDNEEFQAAVRLANALNAVMRVGAATGFKPWLSAFAGNDYQSGQVRVLTPTAAPQLPECVLPASLTGIQLFVNNIRGTAGSEISFATKLFPSRLVRSYQNYPEIFDAPYAATQFDSDSVIDVNPADGQEITAMIPFFGEGSVNPAGSPLGTALVVFKSNSIYLVNVETRDVEKIHSRGLGCTAPRSVAVDKQGIVFANESGVYRLGRDMTITQIGINLTGVWRDTVNKSRISEAYGHHYGQGRRYKLSVPVNSGLYNSDVLVYDYERENRGQEYGAWTTYDNHPATGWCNLDQEAYWSSTAGDVFKLRNLGTATDYRDEDQAVSEAVVTPRAEDFDLPGVRKAIGNITTLVELEITDLSDLRVEVAQNLSRTFEDAGDVSITRTDFQQYTFRSTPPARRGTHVQVRYRHAVKDQDLTLTGLSYNVAQVSPKTIPQAGDT